MRKVSKITEIFKSLEKAGLNLKVGRISPTEDYSKVIEIEVDDLPSYVEARSLANFTLWGEEVYPYAEIFLNEKVVHLHGGWMLRNKRSLANLSKSLGKLGFSLLVDSLPLK